MDPVTGAALIGAGSSLVGGLMGSSANKAANEANAAAMAQNVAMQREFAQNGIRWKVADAKAAGIHPLYALGASAPSFSPVSLGQQADMSMPNAMANMGQDISRAVGATRTEAEKQAAQINLASAQANLDGQIIDNQIKQRQLQNMSTGAPSFPGSTNFIPGQGNSGLAPVTVKPKERTASEPGRLAQEAGWVPDVGYSRTDTGLTPVVPQGLSESLEDDIIGKFMWRMRNQLVPNLSGQGSPPKSQLPKGYDRWTWSHARQEWQPEKADPKYDSRKQWMKDVLFDSSSAIKNFKKTWR